MMKFLRKTEQNCKVCVILRFLFERYSRPCVVQTALYQHEVWFELTKTSNQLFLSWWCTMLFVKFILSGWVRMRQGRVSVLCSVESGNSGYMSVGPRKAVDLTRASTCISRAQSEVYRRAHAHTHTHNMRDNTHEQCTHTHCEQHHTHTQHKRARAHTRAQHTRTHTHTCTTHTHNMREHTFPSVWIRPVSLSIASHVTLVRPTCVSWKVGKVTCRLKYLFLCFVKAKVSTTQVPRMRREILCATTKSATKSAFICWQEHLAEVGWGPFSPSPGYNTPMKKTLGLPLNPASPGPPPKDSPAVLWTLVPGTQVPASWPTHPWTCPLTHPGPTPEPTAGPALWLTHPWIPPTSESPLDPQLTPGPCCPPHPWASSVVRPHNGFTLKLQTFASTFVTHRQRRLFHAECVPRRRRGDFCDVTTRDAISVKRAQQVLSHFYRKKYWKYFCTNLDAINIHVV